MKVEQAKKLAWDAGLDLVEVAPNVRPPVCRIMDYSKFKFEQKLKQKKQNKNKSVEMKELRFRPGIAENDLETKVRSLKKFLEEGRTVQLSLRFKKREMIHKEHGFSIINKVIEAVSDMAIVDRPAKLEGASLIAKISPKKRKEGNG